jgi:hypothetical protein
MEYFKDDESFDGGDGQIIEENQAPQDINDVISAEPIEPVRNQKKTYAETIEVPNNGVVSHLKPQERKNWRFSFKNEENKNQLTKTLKSIPGHSLTVEYSIAKDSADITLKNEEGKEVGIINLLLCDRRNVNLSEKYYCKIYFGEFTDQTLYEAVKAAVVNFFESINKPSTMGGKRNKPNRKLKTHKKKRINRRKKTSKRS